MSSLLGHAALSLGKRIGRVVRWAARTGLHKWVATSYASQVIIKWLEKRLKLLDISRLEVCETTSPVPSWSPVVQQRIPYEGRHAALDPASLSTAERYVLGISAVVPRPIALICSLSATGDLNLAPFSYFGIMSHDPLLVVVSVCRSGVRGGDYKDTARNIIDTKEFVVNIISRWFVEAANHTCGNFAPGVNELALAGLTAMPSHKVKPPRVAESAVHLECTLRHQYDVKNSSGADTATMFIGEVLMMHVHEGVEGVSPSGKLVVDPKKLLAISRLGGMLRRLGYLI